MEIQVGEIRLPRELIPVEVSAYMIQSMMMFFWQIQCLINLFQKWQRMEMEVTISYLYIYSQIIFIIIS